MIRNKNIANVGWIIGCKIVQSVLALIISMLTARYLGPSQFGVINYAAAVVAFVTPIAKLGLSHIIVQEIVYSPDDEGKILGSSIMMSLFSSVLCMMGVISFSIIANPTDRETIIVCSLYSVLLIAQSLELIQYWFQAKLMSKYPSIISVVIYIVISIYKAVLLLLKADVFWFAISNAIDHLLIGIVLTVIYQNKSKQKLKFSFIWMKKLLKQSKYFIIPSMMVTIFAQTDKIMLKFMIDDVATGIYSAASACAGMTSFIFAAVMDSMRPTILEYKKDNSPAYEISVCRLYAVVIYLALAQSIAMTLFAKQIIWILYGNKYFDAISVLRIVVWHTTFSYIGSVRNIWMLAEGKQKYLWIINLCGVMGNVILNLCLIPLWGIEGAALASVITQVFTNFIVGFIMNPIRYNNVLLLKSLNPKIVTNMIKTVFH